MADLVGTPPGRAKDIKENDTIYTLHVIIRTVKFSTLHNMSHSAFLMIREHYTECMCICCAHDLPTGEATSFNFEKKLVSVHITSSGWLEQITSQSQFIFLTPGGTN
jgi:uncharacterized protein YbaA (DUF1428 family)